MGPYGTSPLEAVARQIFFDTGRVTDLYNTFAVDWAAPDSDRTVAQVVDVTGSSPFENGNIVAGNVTTYPAIPAAITTTPGSDYVYYRPADIDKGREAAIDAIIRAALGARGVALPEAEPVKMEAKPKEKALLPTRTKRRIQLD